MSWLNSKSCLEIGRVIKSLPFSLCPLWCFLMICRWRVFFVCFDRLCSICSVSLSINCWGIERLSASSFKKIVAGFGSRDSNWPDRSRAYDIADKMSLSSHDCDWANNAYIFFKMYLNLQAKLDSFGYTAQWVYCMHSKTYRVENC